MILKEFISNSLSEIINGIKEAQEPAKEAGAIIMPPLQTVATRDNVNDYMKTFMREVEFDIAVTVSEGNETGITAGAFISVLGMGAKDKTNNQNLTVSRLKFTVPVIYPVQK